MSSEVGIHARGLGKKYELHDSAFGALKGAMFGLPARDSLWALRDIDFDATPGDFIGIIGQNGAGKSTLLEIISGTLTPTTGTLAVTGHVAALLELGAGFNPDFTGIENARLCATVYGLTSKQIDERLPAIAAFAGIGDFMDRPTREYSSGMFARLAFSVCVHVDADILIVDEILGVGDARFQQRSMRFLREFAKDRVVLFVTHNDAAVLSLCNKAIWLSGGRAVVQGDPNAVVYAYHKSISSLGRDGATFRATGSLKLPETRKLDAVPDDPADKVEYVGPSYFDFDRDDAPTRPGVIGGVELTCEGEKAATLEGGEDVSLAIRLEGRRAGDMVAFAIRDTLGGILAYRDTPAFPHAEDPAVARTGTVTFRFMLPFIRTANYAIDVAVYRQDEGRVECVDRQDTALSFDVVSHHIGGGLANIAQPVAEIVTGSRAA